MEKLGKEFNQNWTGENSDPRYIQLFTRVWDVIYDHFVQTIKRHADAYLKSPAGIKFDEHYIKEKKKKHATVELNSATLRNFEGAKGIEWGAVEICEFWSPICQVAEAGELETSVNLSTINHANLD